MVLRKLSYFVGLSVGQVQDPSAIAVMEEMTEVDQSVVSKVDFQPLVNRRLNLRYLERPALGSAFPAVLGRAAVLCRALWSERDCACVSLVVDATALGRPSVAMVRAADLGMGARRYLLVVETGRAAPRTGDFGAWHVSKRDVVEAVQMAFYDGEVAIPASLKLSDLLLAEMQNFRMSAAGGGSSAAGSDPGDAWRSGKHSDLVLAVGLPVWVCRAMPRPGTQGKLLYVG